MKKSLGLKRKILISTLLVGTIALGGIHMASAATPLSKLVSSSHMVNSSIQDLHNDTRVFKIDSAIETKNVRFRNRYGIEVAGHMYLPKDFDISKKYAAIVISGPFGAVKEQSSGLYAQELAKRGYVTLAFDPSFTGESGGNVRNVASPDIFTEDFSAAIDFVSTLDYVDSNRLGMLGICGLSGMAITSATNDTRVKAVAVSAMYDMSKSIRNHYKGSYYTSEQRNLVKEHLAKMRREEAVTGKQISGSHELGLDSQGNIQAAPTMFPNILPENADPVTKEFYNYYAGRAAHPRAINSTTLAWDSTTPYGFFNFDLMSHVQELGNRPLLIITGDKAHSFYFSEDLYAAAGPNKEMIVVPGATHTDLYDQMDKIPFDKLDAFFDKNL